MAGLDSSLTIIFCSVSGNFHVKSLTFGSLHFLVNVVKLISAVLVTATVAQKAVTNVKLVGVGVAVL